jgi:hypothetical protein
MLFRTGISFMTRTYYVRFNNKDYKENPNLLIELLEYEYKFADIKDNYEKIN